MYGFAAAEIELVAVDSDLQFAVVKSTLIEIFRVEVRVEFAIDAAQRVQVGRAVMPASSLQAARRIGAGFDDDAAGAAQLRDFIDAFTQQPVFHVRQVVFGLFADFIEQLQAALVVENFGGMALRVCDRP